MNIDNVIPLIGVSVFLLVALPFGYALGGRVGRNYIIREESRPKTESERLDELLGVRPASAGPVLQDIASETMEKERRRRKRDYIFFGAGVLATAVLTLIVQALFS
jgi:hypothetical protein